MNVSTIILAAGRSARLGEPKQLLKLGTQNLVNHSVAVAVEVTGAKTLLVLGANNRIIIPELERSPAVIIQNPDWEEGMASSIRIGLRATIDLQPELDAVILMVCDQPFISAELLTRLITSAETSVKGIVASEYEGIPGTPVLFKAGYFQELLNLQGDHGAKPLVVQHADDLLTIPFERGHIDIDTREDYERAAALTKDT